MALILGIESSCDETGVALYNTEHGLLAHTLHSQIALHNEYGGVVPELASRDHVRHTIPLIRTVLDQAQRSLPDISHIAFTQGPGLSGALLVGSSIACSLAYALNLPTIPVHHLEGHLLSPLLSDPAPTFPFIALLVSGGHTQLMHVENFGNYTLMGETLDDAAGEAFDKSAKLLGLAYPGGALLAKLAQDGVAGKFKLPRPMLHSGDLDFSFSGLKTAVSLAAQQNQLNAQTRADIAHAAESAIVDVLASKAVAAVKQSGLKQLVIAGGVGANQRLRTQLNQAAQLNDFKVFYPELEFCTDNGAMIAFAAAMRLRLNPAEYDYRFNVKPRWDLQQQ